MKFFIVLAVTVACAWAAPQSNEAGAEILSSVFDSDPESGSFQYGFDTANGINVQAQGRLNNKDTEYEALEIDGAVGYNAPDGSRVELTYKADENGYQPQGSHLPVGPEIPPYIIRALQYIAEHTPETERRL